jgi:hypothetical protein
MPHSTDDTVQIRDASRLWGKDTFETQKPIQQELADPEIKVVCIGPAGENLVRFACLITEVAGAAARGGSRSRDGLQEHQGGGRARPHAGEHRAAGRNV